MRKLLVIIPDYVTAILEKGEYQPSYYNPGGLFEEVHLLLTNPDRPDLRDLQWAVGDARLHVHNLPEACSMASASWEADGYRYLRDWAAPAVRLAGLIGPDLVRCHGADLNVYLAARIKEELGVPYVVSLHINPDVNATRRYLGDGLTDEQREHNRFFEFIEREGLTRADLVLPVYRPIIPYLERLGVERHEVCYNVLNGRDLRRKEDYALHDPVRVISVGRQFEEKNPQNLIRAVAAMPNVRLTLVGDGPLHGRLREIVASLGVEGRVEFRPAVVNSELCRILAEHDVFAIHTDYWELNKSLLEAMLVGLPIVMNRRRGPAVPELVGLGFVAMVDDTPEGYRSALARLIEDDAHRAEVGRLTYEHAQARWAPALTEARYVDVYKRTAKPFRRREATRAEASGAGELDVFRCLSCGSGPAEATATATFCAACGTAHHTASGIPLLVRDWRAHDADMRAAQAVKPDWYVEAQPAEDASPWRHHVRKRRRYVERVIRDHLRARGLARAPRILDLGCGDGNNLVWLRPFAERLYGSDYNVVRLVRAQARVPDATLFLADILDYPCADGVFDLVFFNHVIEHIQDDEAALATVARILKPGGLLVLGTPNEGAWWWQLAYDRAPETRASTDHVHFYTAPTISARVAAQGLAVRHVEHMGWGPPDWHWDMRLRGSKFLDDAFELVGRILLRSQASSLYVIAERPRD